MSDWQMWNDMTDTQRLVSWREACDQLAEARAEVERLRAVLQYLRDTAEASEDARYGTLSTKWVMGIAREALRLPARATDSRGDDNG